MKPMYNIGKIYQGQTVAVSLSTDKTEELEEKDVYIGIYNFKHMRSYLASTTESTLTKIEVDDKVYFICDIPASATKEWKGTYSIEVLIKNTDKSYVNISEDVVFFDVEPRYIKEVL